MAKLFHALMKERKSFISVHLMSALTSLDREHFDPLTKIVSYSIIYGLMVKILWSQTCSLQNQETNKFEECQCKYKLRNYNINTMEYWIYFELV